MGELRKDYLLDRYSIIASERARRPKQFVQAPEQHPDVKLCFFCPGHEDTTPPEIGRIGDGQGGWSVRWFPNKFPAVMEGVEPTIRTDNGYFTWSGNFGMHEVIAETPDHGRQLWDLSAEAIAPILGVYRQRIEALSRRRGVRYVLVFKNHGKEGGTSLVHSHTQVTALNIVPDEVRQKEHITKEMGRCPYCDIVAIERTSHRRIIETDRFAAFCPYASEFNFEALIMPKRHVTGMTELDETDLHEMARCLATILAKLKELNAPYNYYLHYGIDRMHLYLRVTPRLNIWAGLEHGSGAKVITVSPEDAAAFYRGEKD
ncbi:hypothetical protein JXB02_00130 [Candidatus Woesearchaeota archaeon]|nr:hypothetical protein [Candidatus Woesearchaeota archaeon]